MPGKERINIRIACTSSDAPWGKKHAPSRFQVEDTIEADGQTFLKLDGDWGRYSYDAMGGMVNTQYLDVHSISFLNSALLNLDSRKNVDS